MDNFCSRPKPPRNLSFPLSRHFKPLSLAIPSTSQPAKPRKTSHRGDAGTEDKHPTTCHITQSDDREECEYPRYGNACPQVFLSHSGRQKSFAEQLCVDLQRENISCFFDKDPQSLPKGENFPTRIFEAASKCRVAVVVLSEKYISSKWPMEELCAFCRAQKSNPNLKILTLFFGLTPQLLNKKLQKKNSLKRSWQKLLESEKRQMNLDEWASALEALRPINGIEYNEEEGEVAYRAQIVRAIRGLVPPNLPYNDSFVQGRERLGQVVVQMFNDTRRGEDGVKKAGLYGVPGIGKTTLAKIACDFHSKDFDGRVLHVELCKEMAMKRLKHALQILTDASETLVNSVTDVEQGWSLFKRKMEGRKVFLAVDNISDLPGSTEEALKYLEAVRSAGNQSTILLISRSSTILRRLIPKGEGSCTHVPSLEEEEAIAVLLQLTPLKVSNLSSEDQNIAKQLVRECCFRWHCTQDDGYNMPSTAYYHPALKAFGTLLYDRFKCPDLSQWIEILKLSKPCRSGYILKDSFPTWEDTFLSLRQDFKKIFMYLYLYLPQSDMTSEAVFKWLASVCDTEAEGIKLAIVELEKKGFVESRMESGHRLYIHDLYREFAVNKADGSEEWILVNGRPDILGHIE